MREIKFRFWIKEKEVMVQDVRIHGKLNSKLNQQWLVPMQFTGLKDKNGKEIYEGDVLNFDWRLQETSELYADDCENIKGVVRFQNGKYVVWFFNNSMSFDLSDINQNTLERFWRETYVSAKDDYFKMTGFEVVGNIYQNPELLNGT